MNRDFEIKQLLRAYRSGILSEAAFEEEIARIEREVSGGEGPQEGGFQAFGRVFRSEREAVLMFLDELHATQMETAVGFARWAAVCRTPGLRTGLTIIAERNAYHARILERRLGELGGEMHVVPSERGQKLVELLANRDIADRDKLAALSGLMRDPGSAAKPLLDFCALLRTDVESQQALRLLAEDEMSSANWLHELSLALSGGGSAAEGSGTPPNPR